MIRKKSEAKILFTRKRRCEVCGTKLVLDKSIVYLVVLENGALASLGSRSFFNAVDCPKCGCQTILKQREVEIEGGLDDGL